MQKQHGDEATEQANASNRSTVGVISVAGAWVLAFAALMAWRLTASITGPLRTALDATARQSNSMAGSVSTAAVKGGDVVGQVVATMEDISASSRKIADIVSQVKRVATLISEISASAHEQTGGISQINQAIAQLDHVTQQNAALVEEAAAAAESLNQQSARMVEVVSVFKLGGNGQ